MLPAPRLVIGEILRELAVPVVFFSLLSVSSLKVIEESGNVRVIFFCISLPICAFPSPSDRGSLAGDRVDRSQIT